MLNTLLIDINLKMSSDEKQLKLNMKLVFEKYNLSSTTYI